MDQHLNPAKPEEFDGKRLAKALGVPVEIVEQYGMTGCLIARLVERIEKLLERLG